MLGIAITQKSPTVCLFANIPFVSCNGPMVGYVFRCPVLERNSLLPRIQLAGALALVNSVAVWPSAAPRNATPFPLLVAPLIRQVNSCLFVSARAAGVRCTNTNCQSFGPHHLPSTVAREGSCLKTGQHFIFVIIYLLLSIKCIILDSVSKILFNFFIANNNNYDSNNESIAP